jgi:hypothetical protein
MKRNDFTIVDYFGPYPIDWDMYDKVMGIKKPSILDLKTNIKYNYKDFFNEKLNEKRNLEK